MGGLECPCSRDTFNKSPNYVQCMVLRLPGVESRNSEQPSEIGKLALGKLLVSLPDLASE